MCTCCNSRACNVCVLKNAIGYLCRGEKLDKNICYVNCLNLTCAVIYDYFRLVSKVLELILSLDVLEGTFLLKVKNLHDPYLQSS